MNTKNYCLTFFLMLPFLTTSVVAQDFFQTPIADSGVESDAPRLLEAFGATLGPIDEPRGVRKVLWTTRSDAEYNGVEFGKSKELGTRYAVVGWNDSVEVGTLFVVSTAQPRLLKESTNFETLTPSEVANDDLWISGSRLDVDGQAVDTVGAAAGLARDAYTVWTFPEGTRSRAIRFSHTPQPTDKTYAGWVGAVYVLSPRLVNLAPFAIVQTESQNQKSSRLTDGMNNDVWQTWENGKEGREVAISPENPEKMTLIWPSEVPLRGLVALWTGFEAADAQIYIGDSNTHPNDSTNPADWQTVASRNDLQNGYWRALYPNFLDFGKTYRTRAVRLLITKVARETHPHLNGNTKNGHRVWLGEWMALAALENGQKSVDLVPKLAEKPHAPIPVRFSLDRPGEVTLVVETPDGKRVRNLISQTPFPAGEHTVWWDGCDDLLRDPDKPRHGVWWIPPRPVAPGEYVVRGMVHDSIATRYEFSVYTEGNPPWRTADNTGWWLTNHTPPTTIQFLPGSDDDESLLYIGSYVSEGGHGLAWFHVNEDATLTKRGGVNWVGGVWTGAKYLARDLGPDALPEHRLYAAAGWGVESRSAKGEFRLTALTDHGDQLLGKFPYETDLCTPPERPGDAPQPDHEHAAAGLAVWNARVLLGFAQPENQLLCVDAKSSEVLWSATLPKNVPTPIHGMAFDSTGRFYLLTGDALYRFRNAEDVRKSWPSPLIQGLDEPRGIALGPDSNLYVSVNGTSNQILVHSPNGKFLRAIGRRGPLQVGTYNPLQMHMPTGMTFDAQGRLWVAECNHQPKRVSVWWPDGRFVRAFYGPAQYGGGGALDAGNPDRYLFGGMEFQIDWKSGEDQLLRILGRKETTRYDRPDGHYSNELPERTVYARGNRYLTNAYNQNPTGGAPIAVIFAPVESTGDGEIRPIAACGIANNWSIFQRDEFQNLLPEGVELRNNGGKRCRFLWSDRNDDGRVQPSEVEFQAGNCGGVTVQVLAGRLAFLCARVESKDESGKELARTMVYPCTWENENRPIFEFERGTTLAEDVLFPASSGGDQVLYDFQRKEAFITLGVGGYPQSSLCGTRDGKSVWSYPSLWPGLHASHESSAPTFPGQLVGTTRLLGDTVRLPNYPARMVAVNGNMGGIYLFTMDGLFIAELFHDERTAPTWSMPVARRGIDLSALTLGGENFWPTITQLPDGKTYLVDGARTSIIRLDGLESVRPLPSRKIQVSESDLNACAVWIQTEEVERQKRVGKTSVTVPLGSEATVDGQLDEWDGADWMVIDRSGVAAWFDSNSKPYDVTAAARFGKERLYIAFRTGQKDLLSNTGELPLALFKCGGCLDLMLGTLERGADNARRNPVVGDQRLLVTRVDGAPRAVRYRPVVPGTQSPVPFASPWRSYPIDRVDDVSDQIQLADDGQGNFELSIPLAALDLNAAPGLTGLTFRADLGILRGHEGQTVSRTYWSNKATGITSDVPSEAELVPNLWGEWKLK